MWVVRVPPIRVRVPRHWLALFVQPVLLSNILPEMMMRRLYRVVNWLRLLRTVEVVVLFVLVGLQSLPVARPLRLLSRVAFCVGRCIAFRRRGYLSALNRPLVCTWWRPLICVVYLVLYIRTAVRQQCGSVARSIRCLVHLSPLSVVLLIISASTGVHMVGRCFLQRNSSGCRLLALDFIVGVRL